MIVLAHQTWFVDSPESFGLDLAALASAGVLAGIAAAVVVTLAWRAAAARRGAPELPGLSRLGDLVPWVPRLLAIHLGISLLALSAFGAVLDPGVHVPAGAAGAALLAPQLVAGALLVLGRHVRLAAGALVAAGPVLLVLQGPRQLLASLVLLGIAVFLLLAPPAGSGRSAVGTAQLSWAVLALRVGAAGSLVVLAVTEKLANPAMAAAMLEQQPLLNVLSPIGVSDASFVVLAGCVELLFGLLVLSGAAPQLVALVAAVPFTATLALFGTTELVGHLPVYGVLLALLVLGSRADTAAAVRSFGPPRVDSPVEPTPVEPAA